VHGVLDGSEHTLTRKVRVCTDYLLNGFSAREFLQDELHRDTRTFNHRLSEHDIRVGYYARLCQKYLRINDIGSQPAIFFCFSPAFFLPNFMNPRSDNGSMGADRVLKRSIATRTEADTSETVQFEPFGLRGRRLSMDEKVKKAVFLFSTGAAFGYYLALAVLVLTR